MKETVSNKNDLFNLTFDAFTFAVAADCVSFKCHSIHFHIQKPKRDFKYVVGAWDPKSI